MSKTCLNPRVCINDEGRVLGVGAQQLVGPLRNERNDGGGELGCVVRYDVDTVVGFDVLLELLLGEHAREEFHKLALRVVERVTGRPRPPKVDHSIELGAVPFDLST